jgi:predicted transcriptional regulator
MNVPTQLETRLAVLARDTGRPADVLLREAIERYADEEERFLSAVDEGIAAAERSEFVENREVLRWIEERERS